MESGKISVIVPVYNVELYLERCINSIINQTYKNLEIILIDDGSTDSSNYICDKFRDLDSRVKVYHIRNKGVSNARNIGIDMSTGEYIAFVDSDDYIHPQMFEVMFNANKSNYNMIICGLQIVYDEINKFDLINERKNKLLKGKKILKSNYLNEDMKYTAVWGKLYKRKFIDKWRFSSDISYGEDHIFVNKLYYDTDDILFVDNNLYFYFRGNENSICNKQNNFTVRMDQINSYIEEYNYFKNKDKTISSFIIQRILLTTKFRLKKAIERKDENNIKECKIILNKWYEEMLKSKDINLKIKLRCIINIKLECVNNYKMFLLKFLNKIKHSIIKK